MRISSSHQDALIGSPIEWTTSDLGLRWLHVDLLQISFIFDSKLRFVATAGYRGETYLLI